MTSDYCVVSFVQHPYDSFSRSVKLVTWPISSLSRVSFSSLSNINVFQRDIAFTLRFINEETMENATPAGFYI